MSRPGARWTLLLLLALAAVTLRGWGAALGWPLTDADAWADVAWARHPLDQQLLVRLTGGVGGANANFWRPAAMLQFWVERRLFGWHAAGWHAWDLAAHTGASLLLGLFVAATSRSRTFAAAVAVLFAAHPLADEVVPAVARNLDLLLGVGVFGALLGVARGVPAAWALGLLVALGAKESGALVPLWTVGWIALFRTDLAWRARARVAAGYGLGGGIVVAAWLAVRSHVVGGVGGYFSPDRLDVVAKLRYALQRGFVEPVLPGLTPWLGKWPGGVHALVLLACALVLGVWLACSPRLRLAFFGLGLWASYVGLLGVTGTYTRRVLYVPCAGFVLVAAVALEEVWRRRSRGGALVAAAWITTAVAASPLVRPYTDWGVIAQADAVLQDVAVWARVPAGATVYLVDRPYRVDLDPRKWRLWSRAKSLTHGAVGYSVQAWVDEVVPGAKVKTLSTWTLTRPLADQGARVTAEGGAVRVARAGGRRKLARFPGVEAGEADGVLTVRAPTGGYLLVWEGATLGLFAGEGPSSTKAR